MSARSERGDRPPEVESVVRRYHRVERTCNWAVALLVAGVVAVAIVTLPLVTGLLVAITLLALVRVPVVRRRTTARLVSDADPVSVAADFEGATPPPLAFQWGVADAVHATADGAAYDFSYLFGFRSASMETRVRSRTPADDDPVAAIELEVTANGRPWGKYAISVHERDATTVVDAESTTDRRFGLLHLVQGLIADQYYADALAAQGYTVSERDTSLSV